MEMRGRLQSEIAERAPLVAAIIVALVLLISGLATGVAILGHAAADSAAAAKRSAGTADRLLAQVERLRGDAARNGRRIEQLTAQVVALQDQIRARGDTPVIIRNEIPVTSSPSRQTTTTTSRPHPATVTSTTTTTTTACRVLTPAGCIR